MSLPNFITHAERRATSKKWNEAKAAKRIVRGPSEDTIRRRALDDARGQVLREGVCYKSGREILWQVMRSINGRTDQFDLVSDGRTIKTSGPRGLAKDFRP